MPLLFWIGRVCEEFHCLPSEAWREWRRMPEGTLEQIMEMLAYARGWQVYDSAKNKNELPRSPLIQTIKEIDFEIAAEEIRARTDD